MRTNIRRILVSAIRKKSCIDSCFPTHQLLAWNIGTTMSTVLALASGRQSA